ncbi:DoxX family protein [Virgibacillus sp. 179-BFC.A HS]|uniref:DoxX family protein n=1 Tax=Tigheibacillus jepli TaxID=3035914 RepID=A0ABU5CCU2_9BACI|nr:DoxX family protein [Virgibacillus sp. 179-BFC.A HS]MDY0404149.1 DoxX family protein [Virgibacillus sp. 179-BFC.A HS]
MLDRRNWLGWLVGYVFIVSGAMKLLMPGFAETFAQLGVPYPQTTVFVVALCEIGCGACIAGKFAVKEASAILLVIMAGALYFAKLPALTSEGPLQFAFDARLDIVMIVILLILFRRSPRYMK